MCFVIGTGTSNIMSYVLELKRVFLNSSYAFIAYNLCRRNKGEYSLPMYTMVLFSYKSNVYVVPFVAYVIIHKSGCFGST